MIFSLKTKNYPQITSLFILASKHISHFCSNFEMLSELQKLYKSYVVNSASQINILHQIVAPQLNGGQLANDFSQPIKAGSQCNCAVYLISVPHAQHPR